MNKLEVCVYNKGSTDPDKRISLPMAVFRANPKLLPKDIAEALESQGVPASELALLDGVDGTIMDIEGEKSRITISILAGGVTAPAPPPTTTPAAVPPPVAAPAPAPLPPAASVPTPPEPSPEPPAATPAEESKPRKSSASTPFLQKLTTEFIATEIGWRTGHDLIYAACAHLTIAEKLKTWSKEEINDEIRAVSKYYKPFYSTNLDEYLQYLMKNDKLCRADDGHLSLTPNQVKYLEDRLSEEKLKKRLRS